MHPAGPRRRGARSDHRNRPERGSAEVVRGHGDGDRDGSQVLRGTASQSDDGRDRLGRHLVERRRLGRGVRCSRTRNPAQRGARGDLGGAAGDSDGQVRRRRPDRDASKVVAAEQGAAHGAEQGMDGARGGGPGRRPVVGSRLPAQVCPVAAPRRGQAAAAQGRPGLDGVRPAAAGRGAATAR